MKKLQKFLLSIYFLLVFVTIIYSLSLVVFRGSVVVNKEIEKKIKYKAEKEVGEGYYYEKNPIIENCSSVANRFTGIITGNVKFKETGEKARGIKIECVRLSPETANKETKELKAKYGISDKEGEYEIDGLYEGIYEVQVRDENFTAEPQINVGVYGSIVISEVDLDIFKTASVSGYVLDSEKGSPLSGISLVLKPIRGKLIFSSRFYKPGTSNTSGEYSFKNIYPTRYAICVDSEEYAYGGNEEGYIINLSEGEDQKDVNISLTRAKGQIVGIVREEGGKLIEGAKIVLDKMDRETETNIEGKFLLGKLFFRDRDYELIISHPNYVEKRYKFRPKKPDSIQEIVGELSPGCTISGTISNEKGEAVEKANVYIVKDEGEKIRITDKLKNEKIKRSVTDPFGFYRLRGLEEGFYYLFAIGEGYAMATHTLISVKDRESIKNDIVLSEEKTVSGKVQTIAQEAIEGVELELEKDNYIYQTITDEEGKFVFSNLAEGDYLLKANRKIAIKDSIIIQNQLRSIVAGDENVQVTFGGVASIRGVVTESETSQPISSYEIILTPLSEEAGEKTYTKTVENEPNGIFEFKYITAGTYFIKVKAQGYNEGTYGAVKIVEDSIVSDLRIIVMPEKNE